MEIVRQMITVLGLIVLLATLPAALELLLVTSGAIRRRSIPVAKDLKSFSLVAVIPAHNEEALIGRCVASVLTSAANLPRCSVVVVADNCTDLTALRAHQAGARVLVRENAVLRGKGHALRFAFDSLMPEEFDGFLVVDADSVVSPNLVPEIVGGLVAGADAVQARYRVARPLDSKRKRLMDVELVAFNVLRPKGRDGWGLSAGILGNGFALSRRTLLSVPYSADSIVEDLEYHLLLVNQGKKVRFADMATVYGDMPNDAAGQLSQRARWEGGRARLAGVWTPRLAARIFQGDLLVLEPLLELLTPPVAYLTLLSLILCILPVDLFRDYGLFLASLLIVHVSLAIKLGGNLRESLAGLAAAPGYIFWKLLKMGSIIRSSRPEAPWVRTPRASDVNEKAPHV